jgi:hypothetical protein
MGTGIYTGSEVYWPWWDQWGEGAVGGVGSEWVSTSSPTLNIHTSTLEEYDWSASYSGRKDPTVPTGWEAH